MELLARALASQPPAPEAPLHFTVDLSRDDEDAPAKPVRLLGGSGSRRLRRRRRFDLTPRTAEELLADLTEQGFTVAISGDKIAVKPRPSPAIVAEIARHKPELVRLLSGANQKAPALRVEGAQNPEEEEAGCSEAGAISPEIEAHKRNLPPTTGRKVNWIERRSLPHTSAAEEQAAEEERMRPFIDWRDPGY